MYYIYKIYIIYISYRCISMYIFVFNFLTANPKDTIISNKMCFTSFIPIFQST